MFTSKTLLKALPNTFSTSPVKDYSFVLNDKVISRYILNLDIIAHVIIRITAIKIPEFLAFAYDIRNNITR